MLEYHAYWAVVSCTKGSHAFNEDGAHIFLSIKWQKINELLGSRASFVTYVSLCWIRWKPISQAEEKGITIWSELRIIKTDWCLTKMQRCIDLIMQFVSFASSLFLLRRIRSLRTDGHPRSFSFDWNDRNFISTTKCLLMLNVK